MNLAQRIFEYESGDDATAMARTSRTKQSTRFLQRHNGIIRVKPLQFYDVVDVVLVTWHILIYLIALAILGLGFACDGVSLNPSGSKTVWAHPAAMQLPLVSNLSTLSTSFAIEISLGQTMRSVDK